MSLEFLLTTLIVVVSPGTGVLYTLAAGLSRGSRASVVAAFGCTLGIVPHMAAAILGLAALLHTSALAFQTLKWAGVAYLLFMAWNTLKEHGALKVEGEIGARSAGQVIVHAILINVLNPKLSIFFFAFLPQFVSPASAHPTRDLVFLGVLYAVLALPIKVSVGLAAGTVSERVLQSNAALTWMNRIGGTVLIALGLRLAGTDR
jgi:threonine/homoserine/homoserine lactone efflux protein